MTVLNGLRTVCNFSFRFWHNCLESWFPRNVKFLCGKSSQTYYVLCQRVFFFSYFTAALSLHFRLVRLKNNIALNVLRTAYDGELWKPITGHFEFEGNIEGKSNDYRNVIHRFQNTQFYKVFFVHTGLLGNHDKNVCLSWNLTMSMHSFVLWLQCQYTVFCYGSFRLEECSIIYDINL